jgi:hypothetical protein
MELNDLLNPTLIRWLIVAARADLESIATPVRDKLWRPRETANLIRRAGLDWVPPATGSSSLKISVHQGDTHVRFGPMLLKKGS